MKTSELSGAALDWAVAKSELMNGADYTLEVDKDVDGKLRINFGGMYPEWSTDWQEGGAIIEQEGISLDYDGLGTWVATIITNGSVFEESGGTPLEAAMRCYVASKMGNDVQLPEELK